MSKSPFKRTLDWLVIIALVAGGSLLVWDQTIKDDLIPRNFGVVDEGRVYRSGRLTPAATQRVHDKYGIKTIVDLGAYPPDSDRDRRAARTAEALGLDRFIFRLGGDGTGDPKMYIEALKILNDPERQPVLVHCAAGAQRTSGCIMLHRVIDQDMPFDQAFDESTNYKHDPDDNPRLRSFIESNLEAIRDALAQPAAAPDNDSAAGS